MNYRHHYHAGNFADVLKHTLLLALVDALQRKEKGFLFLDTHAGRGSYDLTTAGRGTSLERRPEWPDGIGRVEAVRAEERPPLVNRLVDAVARFRQRSPETLIYPGSPWLVAAALRTQDRMVACERHPEEHAALAESLQVVPRTRVELTDGYAAVRAHLPPRERRALVLIDPPYEAMDEFAQVAGALAEIRRRLPSATVAVWYPLTERARVEAFYADLKRLALPPTWTAELTIVPPDHPARLKGCGLLVVNPPWQLDRAVETSLPWLTLTLAQAPGGEGALRWIVPE